MGNIMKNTVPLNIGNMLFEKTTNPVINKTASKILDAPWDNITFLEEKTDALVRGDIAYKIAENMHNLLEGK